MNLFGFNHSKVKTQCRLGVGRIKLLRNKKQLAMKTLRKEVAELMRQGKQGNARIRVEAVMREHRMLQAFEILELYLELLAVRAELLAKTKEIPPDMVEAISSLIYAGERVSTDLAEVNAVAKMLVGKYSHVQGYKEAGFPHNVVSDITCRAWQVNDDLVTCLAVSAPSPEEKLAFLDSIAAEFDVPFDRDAAALDMLPAVRPQAQAFPVETLAAGGAVTSGSSIPAGGAGQQHPALTPGWQPPAGPAPLPTALQQQPPQQQGWRPPPAEGGAGGSWDGAGAPSRPAGKTLEKMWSDAFVLRRGGGAAPGYTEQPSASADAAAAAAAGDGLAWQPPAPDDPYKRGMSIARHVDAAANWRHHRVHGTGAAGTAGSGSPPPPVDEFIAPERGDLPPPAMGGQGVGPPQQQYPGGWDALAAAGPLAMPPGTAHSSGGSTPSVGEKPMTPGSSYADASAAAEAAKKYSQMAAQAAQRAEEFAATQAAAGAGTTAGGPGGAGDPGAGSSSPGDEGSCGGSGGGGGQVLVPRTLSEIKRAYDAAPGPPTKPTAAAAAAGPPSAPPEPSSDGSSGSALPSVPLPPPPEESPPAAGNGGGAEIDISGLPSVPTAGQGVPLPVEDELDELTRRFEMLKRR